MLDARIADRRTRTHCIHHDAVPGSLRRTRLCQKLHRTRCRTIHDQGTADNDFGLCRIKSRSLAISARELHNGARLNRQRAASQNGDVTLHDVRIARGSPRRVPNRAPSNDRRHCHSRQQRHDAQRKHQHHEMQESRHRSVRHTHSLRSVMLRLLFF